MKQALSFLFALCCTFQMVLAQEATRNCGTMEHLAQQQQEDPAVIERMKKIEQHTNFILNQNAKLDDNQVITIPVVVHVLYRTAAENISNAQIQSQIDVLNEDFRRLNADAANTPASFQGVASDVHVEFCLASVDPNGNATNGITRKSTTKTSWGTNDAMKYSSQGGTNAWPTGNYLNMWVCQIGGGILGYAQFPGGNPATDGVVMGTTYFGNTGNVSAPFNKGRTATHEVGHWLNLRHIWGDGPCGQDDAVADTPASDAPNYGCATGHSSCGSTDMVQNYMDYSDDACMNLFTNGQSSRMRALFTAGGFRASLLNSNGCGSSNPPPPPTATCTDGIQNGNETGVDCGGSCSPCDNTPTYCTSSASNSTYEWIAKVTFGDISNTSGNNNGYGNFTSQSTSVNKGTNYNISLQPAFSSSNYNEHWRVWIDYNADGDFTDNGELAFDSGSASSSTVTGSISIPSTASNGATRMRVQMQWNNPATTACTSFTYGEVEDYTVNIGGTAPTCTDGIQNGTETGVDCGGSCTACPTCTDGIQNGDETGVDCGGSDCSACATCTDGIQNGDETGVDCGGSDCSACATCTDGIQNGNETGVDCGGSCTPCTVTPPSTEYCTSSGQNSNYEWIAKVTFANINNTTGNNNGYGDFTNQTANVAKGSSQSIVLAPGFASSTYNEYWKVWIDYNQDGDFSDSGELAYDSGSATSSTVTGAINIPSTATTGTTRMRVQMKWNGATQTACDNIQYGEVEDYTVNISGSDGGNPPPSNVDYCESAGENSSYEYIHRVVIGNMSNTSGNNNGYKDYTNKVIGANKGSSISVALTPRFGSSSYNEYWLIWIDYNQDGDFSDSGELAFDSGSASSTQVTGAINIPTTANSGATRVRVQMNWNTPPNDACTSFQYGEVEDYTININGSARTTETTNTIAKELLTINVYPNPATTTINIDYTNMGTEKGQINIFDLTGRLLIQQRMGGQRNTETIAIGDLPSGTYLVQLDNGRERVVQKFIKY